MSNTIRRCNRKGKDLAAQWLGREVRELQSGGLIYKHKYLTDYQYVVKQIHRFHSDKYKLNAPSDYRRLMNKLYRSKNNQLLKNAIVKDLEPDPIFIPFKHNVNYHYW